MQGRHHGASASAPTSPDTTAGPSGRRAPMASLEGESKVVGLSAQHTTCNWLFFVFVNTHHVDQYAVALFAVTTVTSLTCVLPQQQLQLSTGALLQSATGRRGHGPHVPLDASSSALQQHSPGGLSRLRSVCLVAGASEHAHLSHTMPPTSSRNTHPCAHTQTRTPHACTQPTPTHRPESFDPLLGPQPGGSSPIQQQDSKRLKEQVQQLKAELKAAHEGCRQQQQAQLAADRRAGEFLDALQKRGEHILWLNSELDRMQQTCTQLRVQVAAGGGGGDAAGVADAAPAGGSSAGTSTPPGAASSNGNGASSSHQPSDVIPRAQHEAAVHDLQQQVQMQAEQIEKLLQARSSPVPPPVVPPPLAAPVSPPVEGSGSTDDLAAHIDQPASPGVALLSSPAAAADLSASAAVSALKVQQGRNAALQKQYDELTAFVKQLEAQASQREALMGGLLAQVCVLCMYV